MRKRNQTSCSVFDHLCWLLPKVGAAVDMAAMDMLPPMVLGQPGFNRLKGEPRKLPVLTKNASGSDMIPAVMIRTIAWIILGSMDVLQAASAATISSGFQEEAENAFGSTASTSASLPTTTGWSTIGCGIATRSRSIRTRTTLAGTSVTT